MNREEEALEKKFGRKAPFTVPEGYFEDFASGLMDKLPERESHAVVKRLDVWYRLRPAIMIAASVCAVILTIGAYFNKPKSGMRSEQPSAQIEKAPTYSVMDEAADYTMLDNEQIYAYVTEK
jgi:hypothetical protein